MTVSKAPIIYILWAIGCQLVHTHKHTHHRPHTTSVLHQTQALSADFGFQGMSSTPEKKAFIIQKEKTVTHTHREGERKIPFPFSSVQIIHQIKINVKIKWNIFYFVVVAVPWLLSTFFLCFLFCVCGYKSPRCLCACLPSTLVLMPNRLIFHFLIQKAVKWWENERNWAKSIKKKVTARATTSHRIALCANCERFYTFVSVWCRGAVAAVLALPPVSPLPLPWPTTNTVRRNMPIGFCGSHS